MIHIFNLIKINSGYAQIINNGICVHVTDTKALIFEVIDFNGLKKSFKPIMDYHFINLQTKMEIGLENNIMAPMSIVFVLNFVQDIIKWGLINKKPYLKFENNFDVYEKENVFNFYGKTLVVFNMLMIVISLIKISGEKLIYEFRKK